MYRVIVAVQFKKLAKSYLGRIKYTLPNEADTVIIEQIESFRKEAHGEYYRGKLKYLAFTIGDDELIQFLVGSMTKLSFVPLYFVSARRLSDE